MKYLYILLLFVYFTTEYYTTIFGDDETEVASRTEVYTNLVGNGQSIKPSQLLEEDKIFATKAANTKLNEVESGTSHEAGENDLDNHVIQPSSQYSTMVREKASNDITTATPANDDDVDDDENADATTTESNPEESQDSTVATASKLTSSARRPNKPTDSRRVVNNIRKQLNNILEDQISSESQNEEILPSSTLLLQTSFTTFTYFTTQYLGDSSEVLSRLETITNVVTQTLQPTQTVIIAPPPAADEQVPTTYFTTFT